MKFRKIFAISLMGVLLILSQASYAAEAYNYKTLNNIQSFAKQVQRAHTVYEIKYDYDLQGETALIPPDCILKFSGGHLNNGSLVFDNTIIESPYSEVFDQISVSGSIANHEVRLSWWKLAYNKEYNDAPLINEIISAIDNCTFYFDIQQDIFVGGGDTEGTSGEIINITDNNNLRVVQPTEYYTVLRGRSKGGHVICLSKNKYISVDGLKIDGGHISYGLAGENGLGVTGNEKVLIENCIIKNCFSDCYNKAASGTLTKNGYPEWGSGGKGIQIEGGVVATQATIRSNSIKNCYIGISNNASDQENIIMEGNYIDSCYMSLILLRLGGTRKRMNVNISNTIIANNTGDVGAICMGNVANVNMTNTQVKGGGKLKSLLRGCFSYCNIQMIVNQECENLIDAALYRDNPEGSEALHNNVMIIADKSCDYIINTSSGVIPKKGGSTHAEYVGGAFDITVQGGVNKEPIVLPTDNRTTHFKVRMGDVYKSGTVNTINSNNK